MVEEVTFLLIALIKFFSKNKLLQVVFFIGITIAVISFFGGFFYLTGGIGLAVILLLLIGIYFPPAKKLAGFLFFICLIVFIFNILISLLDNKLISFHFWQQAKVDEINLYLEEDALNSQKKRVSSEVTKGTFGYLVAETVVYDEKGRSRKKMSKGTKVMFLNSFRKHTRNQEGLVLVMFPNKNGDFVNGPRGFIPIRNVRWGEKPKKWVLYKSFWHPKKLAKNNIGQQIMLPAGRYRVCPWNVVTSRQAWDYIKTCDKSFVLEERHSIGVFSPQAQEIKIWRKDLDP